MIGMVDFREKGFYSFAFEKFCSYFPTEGFTDSQTSK